MTSRPSHYVGLLKSWWYKHGFMSDSLFISSCRFRGSGLGTFKLHRQVVVSRCRRSHVQVTVSDHHSQYSKARKNSSVFCILISDSLVSKNESCWCSCWRILAKHKKNDMCHLSCLSTSPHYQEEVASLVVPILQGWSDLDSCYSLRQSDEGARRDPIKYVSHTSCRQKESC